MTITIAGLLAADTATIRAFAGRFEGLAHLVDDTVADLSAATRDLPNYWSAGTGSAAARQHDADLRQQLATAYEPVDVGAHVIRYFADSLDQCRQMLGSVVREAEGKGFQVDLPSGRVTAPAEPIDPVIGLAAAQSTVEYYVARFEEIVAQADEADQSTRRQLEQLGTGGLELQTVLPKGYLPYDGRAIAGLQPVARSDWWHRLNPLTREQYAIAFPDVVGSAEGIPSRDRDLANRILLERRRTQLAAQEQELSDRFGGAGTPLLQQVQLDRAAAERLQAQLDDPARPGYLVDYRPGDEQHATLTAAGSKWDALWVN
jgi:hypothetical protein